jgi:hypothetical protein
MTTSNLLEARFVEVGSALSAMIFFVVAVRRSSRLAKLVQIVRLNFKALLPSCFARLLIWDGASIPLVPHVGARIGRVSERALQLSEWQRAGAVHVEGGSGNLRGDHSRIRGRHPALVQCVLGAGTLRGLIGCVTRSTRKP